MRKLWGELTVIERTLIVFTGWYITVMTVLVAINLAEFIIEVAS